MKALVLISAFLFPFNMFSSILTVTSLGDAGAGTLRDAINNSSNGDTIDFNVSGVITLSSVLDISKDLTIIGPGADILAIDGNGTTSIFKDQNNTNNTVNISHLEIRNGTGGSYGAAIGGLDYNLNISYCNIHSNSLTGAYGAGISAQNGGNVTIEYSSIHNNSSSGNGSGIFVGQGGTLTIRNSTFFGNLGSNGSAIFVEGADVNLINVSVLGNGGNNVISISDYVVLLVLSKAASFSSTNSIFENTWGNYAYNPALLGGANESSGGGNISNDNSMISALSAASDLNNTNSLLDPVGLQNNGGTTPTVALLCGSPAINSGVASAGVPLTDQRNFPRIGTPDRGALESNKLPSNSVEKITACDLYFSPSGKYTWTSSNVYYDTIPNAVGCDSIMTIDLIIAPPLDGGNVSTY